jgi:hypothetical protein
MCWPPAGGELPALSRLQGRQTIPRRASRSTQRCDPPCPTGTLRTRLRLRTVSSKGRRRRAELTEYGCELEPIVLALGRWGFRSMSEPRDDDILTADSLTMALRTALKPEIASASLGFSITGFPDPCRGRRVGCPGQRRRTEGGPDRSPGPPVGGSLPSSQPELRFATGSGIRHLISLRQSLNGFSQLAERPFRSAVDAGSHVSAAMARA